MKYYGSTSTLTKALSQIYFHISGKWGDICYENRSIWLRILTIVVRRDG